MENRLMDMARMGKGGECGRYGESNTETCITMCKIANGNLLYDSRNSNGGSITT